MIRFYAPAWLLAPLPSFWKRKKQMKRDPQQVVTDFRDHLIRSLDQALADHAKDYALIEILDSQIQRLRMVAASRPR